MNFFTKTIKSIISQESTFGGRGLFTPTARLTMKKESNVMGNPSVYVPFFFRNKELKSVYNLFFSPEIQFIEGYMRWD